MTQNITTKSLSAFSAWLRENGRSEGTARLYSSNLRSCAADAGGVTARLVSELAPKSLHTNRAALRAWAKYTEDDKLEKKVNAIRLPTAARVRAKIPFTPEDWKRIIGHVKAAKWMSEPMRVVILIMALRGFRSGDALRIRRREVVDGLATGTLSVEGKGRRRRELSVKPIRAELEALKKIPGWEVVADLFGKIQLRAVSNKVERAVRRVGRELKIDTCHPHRLRRTVAVQFLKTLGPDPEAITKLMAFMAWSNAATAISYVDAVNKEEVEEIGSRMLAWADDKTP